MSKRRKNKKKTVALKMRNCKKCNDGYYIALYHERHTNDFIRVGSNCACEKRQISDEHVSDLRDEMLHPEKYAPPLALQWKLGKTLSHKKSRRVEYL